MEDLIMMGLGFVLFVYLIFMIAIIVYNIICMWFIFKKAGEEGWKSIIPVYNLIVLYKIIGLSPYLIFIYLTSFIPVIGIYGPITMTIIEHIWLGKAFKKEPGFIVGLALLPLVFLGILAFDKSEYRLKKDNPIEVQ